MTALAKSSMHYAFCLFNYYPFGGLGRDFISIAKACLARGHTIDVYTQTWQGPLPTDMQVTLIPYHGFSNHRRNLTFAKRLQSMLPTKNYAAVVGFNRMPGLDIYYAADLCFRAASAAKHGWLYRLGSRFRTYAYLEQSVFASDQTTQILLINAAEKSIYQRYYATADARFHFVPPGIERERLQLNNAVQTKITIRQQLGITSENYLLLTVGSSFHTKGIDRALYALAALPTSVRQQSLLAIVGNGKTKPLLKLAARLGIQQQVQFLGACENIGALMHSADLLLHPARHETAGNVLVEALVCGLPVLVTENCGYAHHVKQAQAGMIVPMPFCQNTLNSMLTTILTDQKNSQRLANALSFAATTDLYSLPERSAEIIETVAKQKW
ncbi:glycosyltransferase family 4 protein [soil metagenome]